MQSAEQRAVSRDRYTLFRITLAVITECYELVAGARWPPPPAAAAARVV